MNTDESGLPVEPAWLADKRANDKPIGVDLGDRQLYGTPFHDYELSRGWSDMKENGLTRDVAFNRHSMNDGHHVSPFDNAKVQVGTDGIEVALAQGIDEDAFRRTLSAATRATIGIDIEPHWVPCDLGNALCKNESHVEHSSNREEYPAGLRYKAKVDPLEANEDWTEMLKGGLQTALETQVVVFAVKGASRTCTHQLVRSRRAAFHQQSQRASYVGDFPECRMPESVWRNYTAREAFLEGMIACHRAYRTICEQDISYQDARFILPEGTTNFILLEYPVREFLNVYAYRACSMFQWEIVDVMRKCRQALVEKHPWLKPYIKISCQTGECQACGGVGYLQSDDDYAPRRTCVPCAGTGMIGTRCTFQGWESVEGQCSFPWAKEENRTFKPQFHRIARKES